jgi:hypothetical protein
MALASAYLSDKAEDAAPVTFGLIELGPAPAVDSIGIPFTCRSICGRGIAAQGQELVDAMPPQMLYSDFCHYLSYGTGIRLDAAPEGDARVPAENDPR